MKKAKSFIALSFIPLIISCKINNTDISEVKDSRPVSVIELCPFGNETFNDNYRNTDEYKKFIKKCTKPELSIIQKYYNIRSLAKDYLAQKFEHGDPAYKRIISQATPDYLKKYQIMSEEELLKDISEKDGTITRSQTGNVDFLVNGPMSFKQRDCLIQQAKTSIWIAVWAFYEDATGCDVAYQLIQKRKKGVKIKIIVDGNISRFAPFEAPINLMQESNIEVMEWKITKRDKMSYGMHRKTMIVDGQKAIIGGMNSGNAYSHFTLTDPLLKWRDTDALVTGSIVESTQHVFANLWNSVIDAKEKYTSYSNQSLKRINDIQRGNSLPDKNEGLFVWINQQPSASSRVDHVFMATLKMIYNAKNTIDISNAYFISVDLLNKALTDAIERGVKVRLYTNSEKSIDVATLTKPIFLSANKLFAVNKNKDHVKVYLRQTSTTHSKFLIVDGKMGWIGSYNLHPRSIAYEEEEVMAFFSKNVGKKITNIFESDISKTDEKSNDYVKTYDYNHLIPVSADFMYDWLGETVFEAL